MKIDMANRQVLWLNEKCFVQDSTDTTQVSTKSLSDCSERQQES